jgi:hypothetical protein
MVWPLFSHRRGVPPGYLDSGEDPRPRWQTTWYSPRSTRPRPLREAVSAQGPWHAANPHPSGVAAGHEPLTMDRALSAVFSQVARRRKSRSYGVLGRAVRMTDPQGTARMVASRGPSQRQAVMLPRRGCLRALVTASNGPHPAQPFGALGPGPGVHRAAPHPRPGLTSPVRDTATQARTHPRHTGDADPALADTPARCPARRRPAHPHLCDLRESPGPVGQRVGGAEVGPSRPRLSRRRGDPPPG